MEEQDKSLADPQTVAGQSRCTVEQLTKKNNKVESAATTTTEASPLLAKKPGDSPQTPLLAAFHHLPRMSVQRDVSSLGW